MNERRKLLTESSLCGPLGAMLGSFYGGQAEVFVPYGVPERMHQRYLSLSPYSRNQVDFGLVGTQGSIEGYNRLVCEQFSDCEIKDLPITFETIGVSDEVAHQFLFDVFRYFVDGFSQAHNAWIRERQNVGIPVRRLDS
jgi:hypothetical protein